MIAALVSICPSRGKMRGKLFSCAAFTVSVTASLAIAIS
jgi:hypothetical protein